MEEQQQFLESLTQSLEEKTFIKLTLSKPVSKHQDLVNVYVRSIVLKDKPALSLTYRHKTQDQVKNFDFTQGVQEINNLFTASFKVGTLFSTDADLCIQRSKKGKLSLKKNKPSLKTSTDSAHDRKKNKRIDANSEYLRRLGVSDEQGKVIPKMADKYRQINKYLEIIEGLIKQEQWQEALNIVDMGSGKGYLTFALYDFLTRTLDKKITIVGVELREELVSQCNTIAKDCGFEGLSFQTGTIQEFQTKDVDILIALHACDTATDDALTQGIMGEAKLIITAPCCHKQIRQQVKGKKQESPLLHFGIFQERQFEMVTDTIRALILEKHHYKTKIFEFVSNEHTRKNIMLVGQKQNSTGSGQLIDEQIDALKQEFHIDYHELEKCLSDEIADN